MCAAVATDVVHHRTARWEKDSHAESQAKQPASQAETASEPTLLYSSGYMMYYVCFKCSKTEIRVAII